MKRYSITILILLCVAVSSAQSRMNSEAASKLFGEANEQYQQQKYAEARKLYGQIVEAGVESPSLFYNMGNAAARLGRTGEAVLYYEKARELSPRDGDVLANLKRVAPPDNDPQRFILVVPFMWIVDHFSLREWLGAFFAIFTLTGLVGAVYFAFPPRKYAWLLRRGFQGLALGSALVFVFAGTRLYQAKVLRYSIVMKVNAPVYSGPGEKFTQMSAAPEGTKVRRLAFTDPVWAQIQLMDGQRGFIAAESLKSI